MAAVLLVSYASSVRAWLQQRSELALLQTQIGERKAAVAALRSEVRRWQDPAYVETQARERFGWVMPGERGYRVLGLDGRPLGAPRSVAGVPDTAVRTVDWWSTVWRSVQAAGKEPKPKGRSQTPATRIGRDGAARHANAEQAKAKQPTPAPADQRLPATLP